MYEGALAGGIDGTTEGLALASVAATGLGFVFMGNSINTIAGIVRTHGPALGQKTALILGDRQQSWAELYQRSCQMAQALKAVGVGSQDRVAFLDKNGIEHFEVFYGCGLLNAVSVDVNWRLAAPEVLYIVNDAQAKVLVVGPEFVPILDAIADQLTTAKTIVVIGGHERYPSFEDFIASGSADDPGVAAAPDDVAFQLYSSGTTGRPKGVMLTNNNFFALIPFAQEFWGFTDHTVNMAAMPLFHIGGGGWATAGHTMGATTVIVRDINPVEMIQMFGKHRITHAFVVPVLLQFMLMVPDLDKADFSSIELIAYGASPISEEVLAGSLKAFKTNFMQIYGLTETTGATTILMPEEHDLTGPKKGLLRSCGKVVPGMQLRVVDSDSGKDMPVGEVGEIWVKGPQVMKGYWNMPDETAKSINSDGWFRTGDAAYLDAEGYVYIYDRVKDMIVSGGENVYPAEVENALMGHPAIADVAVIGVPDEKWGEVPKALVVRKPDVAVTEEEIISFARERLAGFKTPKSVDWIDALPRNPSGKILKKDLRAPYWEGKQRQVN
jgi:long-chain acyl-CoA synthetase